MSTQVSNYDYDPSLGAAIVAASLYTAVFIGTTVQWLRYRSWVWIVMMIVAASKYFKSTSQRKIRRAGLKRGYICPERPEIFFESVTILHLIVHRGQTGTKSTFSLFSGVDWIHIPLFVDPKPRE